jgi:hypothetical protein
MVCFLSLFILLTEGFFFTFHFHFFIFLSSDFSGSLFRNVTRLFDLDSYNGNLLFVVSPFTRTLQTLVHLMGKKHWDIPTIIQPLCAERIHAAFVLCCWILWS